MRMNNSENMTLIDEERVIQILGEYANGGVY